MVRTPFWATVTRGLEPAARDELVATLPAEDIRLSYRRIGFSTPSIRNCLMLRTIDDLFVDIAVWPGIIRQREALATLTTSAATVDLASAVVHCRLIRHLADPPDFSLTVNFVGRRNYSTDEIKQAVSATISHRYGWTYQPRDSDSVLNIRLFIEHDLAFVGMRLAAQPLHERAYQTATISGSVKPTVAAAMVSLGAFPPGAVILDPCCGAGTIPIEAVLMGYTAMGSDIDPDALAAAQRNGMAAGIDIPFHRRDARALPFPVWSFDGIVSNLPWGRQVAIAGKPERFYRQVLWEMARVVKPAGRIVLLSGDHASLCTAASAMPLRKLSEIPISLHGQQPVISIWSR